MSDKPPLLLVFLGIGFKGRPLFHGALRWPPKNKEPVLEEGKKTGFNIPWWLIAGPLSVILARYFGFME